VTGRPRVITIDGPASAGKTSVAEALAERLGYHVYDTGALYRAATLLALRAGLTAITAADEDALVQLVRAARIVVAPPKDAQSEPGVTIDGADVTAELRGPAVNGLVSPVSRLPGVRAALMDVQRAAAAAGNVIMVGRDMGTVVVPNADLKLYLTADAHVRAERRTRQLAARGTPRPYDEVLREETARDQIDSGRAIAPLTPAPDAIIIATDHLTLDEITARALAEIAHRAAPDVTGKDATDTPAPPDVPDAAKPHPTKTPAGDRAPTEFVDRFARFHTQGAYHVWYWITKKAIRLMLAPFASLTVRGGRNMPRHGPVIVVANHLHNFDPLAVAIAVPRTVRYMSKKELWRTGFDGRFYELYGAFPVDRSKADRVALRFAERLLKNGEVLGMFPEGTRSPTGAIAHVAPGTAFVAVRTGAPILPVAITGTEDLPLDSKAAPTSRKGGRGRVTVTVGKPFQLTPGPNGKYDMARASDEIMAHIAALLPPRYRGIYADQVAAEHAPVASTGASARHGGEGNDDGNDAAQRA